MHTKFEPGERLPAWHERGSNAWYQTFEQLFERFFERITDHLNQNVPVVRLSSAATTIPANVATHLNCTAITDTHGKFIAATSRVKPISGWYAVNVNFGNTFGGGELSVKKNGVLYQKFVGATGSCLVLLNGVDYIDFDFKFASAVTVTQGDITIDVYRIGHVAA